MDDLSFRLKLLFFFPSNRALACKHCALLLPQDSKGRSINARRREWDTAACPLSGWHREARRKKEMSEWKSIWGRKDSICKGPVVERATDFQEGKEGRYRCRGQGVQPGVNACPHKQARPASEDLSWTEQNMVNSVFTSLLTSHSLGNLKLLLCHKLKCRYFYFYLPCATENLMALRTK